MSVLLCWKNVCNGRNTNGKKSNFMKTTKSASPTGISGATKLPPICKGCVYIETRSGDSGADIIFCSFERTDIIQITKITFCYNRFSSSDPILGAMGRFGYQLL